MAGMRPWLRFFRVVNLPTVPGDTLAGAALALAISRGDPSGFGTVIALAALSLVFLYMFGLADNDIVGAKCDTGRPVPDGEISLRSALVARAACLAFAALSAFMIRLEPCWWILSGLLVLCIVCYNRTKWCVMMGLCRGLGVLCGAAAVGGADALASPAPHVLAAIWTLYIGWVTWFSEGEEDDPSRRRAVGLLIGAIIYLQLLALILFRVTPLMAAGALLLVSLRLLRRILPEVSAS